MADDLKKKKSAAADELLTHNAPLDKMRYGGSMTKDANTWSTNEKGLKLGGSKMKTLSARAKGR